MKRGLFVLAAMFLLMAQGPNTMRTFPSITGTGGIVGLGAASAQYVNATVTVQGYAAPNDGGGGTFQWNASSTATADAGTVFAASGVSTGRWIRQITGPVTPEMWNARGNGTTDDTSAVQACINALVPNSARTQCSGSLSYAISSTISISGVPYGDQIYLGQVVPKGYTLPASWHSAPALFTISGGEAGITLHVNTIIAGGSGTGGSANYSVDVLHITGAGAGLSTFEFDTVEQANIVAKISSITNPSSSNLFIGQSWFSNNLGAWVQGNGAPAEGEIFSVNFIDSNNYGGLYFTDGSHFNNVQSQLDFNGVSLTQVLVSSYSGCTPGLTFHDTTTSATGEVLATYPSQSPSGNVILVIETTFSTGGHSNFATGNAITCGSLSTTISNLFTTNQSSNAQYDDVIQNYQSDPFSKTVINAPYLGGAVGNLLFTNNIIGGNGATTYNNFAAQGLNISNDGVGGIAFTNNATQAGTPFMQLTTSGLALSRTLSVSQNGIFGFNTGPSLPNNTSTPITTLPTPGTLGAVWVIDAYGLNDPNAFASCRVYLPASSTNGDLVCPTALSSLMTLSMSSLGAITATQTTGSTQSVIFTFTRRSG
jgi:hypothetical protein